ncbi:MAG: hypothetical protein JWO41_757 [Candidatus Saccharibacteria bacterium]|nr:hypothetical protein [Candidatus Saccharibacteria bacterium]
MSVQQPESSTQQPDFKQRHPADLDMVHAIAVTAMPEGAVPKPAETTENETAYVELSPEQFFAHFVAYTGERGIDVAAPPKNTDSRKKLVIAAHTLVYNHHLKKHTYEFQNDIEGADPLPLPGLPMRKRVEDFYENPDIKLWATDKVHMHKLHDIQEAFERRYTRNYQDKIPEIKTVYALQQSLWGAGYLEAGLMLSDLLAVYGQALKGLIMAASKLPPPAESEPPDDGTIQE